MNFTISSKKIDIKLNGQRESIIKNILNIKRNIENEKNNETSEIKLGRRLEQRSYNKLSEEILEHLITRYEIDNNKLPTKEELIDMMIDFLGNIPKSRDNYNLSNNISVINKNRKKKLGGGLLGQVYVFNLNPSQTKKNSKSLAYKHQVNEIPYNIDVHATSAVLLAFYGFQPKYYNKYLMENGYYENKNRNRIFEDFSSRGMNIVEKLVDREGSYLIEKNIKWYILHNFTNIADQIHNSMLRVINEEFIKIDLRCLNSETKNTKIEYYLNNLYKHINIFIDKRNQIIKELDKLLIIKEEFLIDLMIFRIKRGCIDISNIDLAIQVECLSSCYRVIKIKKFNTFHFERLVNYCKKNLINKHFQINPALSCMLFIFLKKNILNKNEYNNYLINFNKKSKKFREIADKIKQEEILIDIPNKNNIENNEIIKTETKEKNITENCEEKKDKETKRDKNDKIEEEIKEEIGEEINEEKELKIQNSIKIPDNIKIEFDNNYRITNNNNKRNSKFNFYFNFKKIKVENNNIDNSNYLTKDTKKENKDNNNKEEENNKNGSKLDLSFNLNNKGKDILNNKYDEFKKHKIKLKLCYSWIENNNP